ncbi:MAG: hypothetical protein KF718_30895 [Polyangiaceae bacterium]|nr:hypothetical protein [Polyangiaceae bacterium]
MARSRWIGLVALMFAPGCGGSDDAGGTGGSGALSGDAATGGHAGTGGGDAATVDAAGDAATVDAAGDAATVDAAGDASVATCAVATDCRLYSSYCEGCVCVPLAADAPDPVCRGSRVSCLLDPCENHVPSCSAGSCSL